MKSTKDNSKDAISEGSAVPYRPRGRVDVAIDFSSQIYSHNNHHTFEPRIYSCATYTIWSHAPSIGLGLEKTDFFTAQDIYIDYADGRHSLLLEEEAYKWFMSSERVWNDFNSNDFLEQTFITHTIWRLQAYSSALEPWNEVLETYSAQDRKLQNRFLEILLPKILETSKKFCARGNRKYITLAEVESRATLFVSTILFGESRSHIQKTIVSQRNKGSGKQPMRQEFREISLHPLTTHKNSDTKNIDFDSIHIFAIQQIWNSFSQRLNKNPRQEIEMAYALLQPDMLSMAIAESMSHSSFRVYKPWIQESIIEFAFDARLFNYLKDSFRTENKNRSKSSNIDINLFSEDYVQPISRRKWRKYGLKNLDKDTIEHIKFVLKDKPKQLEVYIEFLNGAYDSRSVSKRQALQNAKKSLIQAGLTDLTYLHNSRKKKP